VTTHDDANRDSAADAADRPPTPVELAWAEHLGTGSDLLDRLVIRYRERQRRYHKIGHVEAVLVSIAALTEGEQVNDLGAIIAAVLYHDAVYEPQHPANERASARLARRDLLALGWADDRANAVAAMIEGTKTHLDPLSSDAAVMNDADLAILGADETEYARYAKAVRDEHTHLDDREWNDGRVAVLHAFLDRDSIYATATGRELWEASARANVSAEIASIRS
jgi:predicted metal-dependent HD superfamily phosphohydrolase|tara:strand:- start:1056 stop:1724 length:669 start_codon:yes stop_codon:yes gene_type:complete